MHDKSGRPEGATVHTILGYKFPICNKTGYVFVTSVTKPEKSSPGCYITTVKGEPWFDEVCADFGCTKDDLQHEHKGGMYEGYKQGAWQHPLVATRTMLHLLPPVGYRLEKLLRQWFIIDTLHSRKKSKSMLEPVKSDLPKSPVLELGLSDETEPDTSMTRLPMSPPIKQETIVASEDMERDINLLFDQAVKDLDMDTELKTQILRLKCNSLQQAQNSK